MSSLSVHVPRCGGVWGCVGEGVAGVWGRQVAPGGYGWEQG